MLCKIYWVSTQLRIHKPGCCERSWGQEQCRPSWGSVNELRRINKYPEQTIQSYKLQGHSPVRRNSRHVAQEISQQRLCWSGQIRHLPHKQPYPVLRYPSPEFPKVSPDWWKLVHTPGPDRFARLIQGSPGIPHKPRLERTKVTQNHEPIEAQNGCYVLPKLLLHLRQLLRYALSESPAPYHSRVGVLAICWNLEMRLRR